MDKKDPKYYVGQRVQFTKDTIVKLAVEKANYYTGDDEGKKLASVLLETRTVVSFAYHKGRVVYQITGQTFGKAFYEEEIESAEREECVYTPRFQAGYTSEEESLRLVAAGIPCNSADMVLIKTDDEHCTAHLLNKPYIEYMKTANSRMCAPCWSAFRLMLIINRWYDEEFDGSFPNTTDVKVSGMNYVEYLVRQIEKFNEKKV